MQENGKLRFAVNIPLLPNDVNGKEEIQRWVLEKLRETDSGRKWLGERSAKDWKKIIVVRNGRTVNFVK